MPGVNRSGMVPAPMRFSVAPFPPASPGVSILFPVISALKESYMTQPPNKQRTSSGAQLKKASCSHCRGGCDWLELTWVSGAAFPRDGQGSFVTQAYRVTFKTRPSLPRPPFLVPPIAHCCDHQMSRITEIESHCGLVTVFKHDRPGEVGAQVLGRAETL